MKKLILGLSLVSFLLFGAIGVQSVMADTFSVDIVKADKIPDKEKDSKKDKKDKKDNSKATATTKSSKSYDKTDGCCSSKATSCCSSKSGSKDTSKDSGKQK